MSKVANTKANLRDIVRRERASLTSEWIASRSENISKRLIALDVFQAAETVCLYMALPGEVSLDGVMDYCWAEGKRVLVPAYCKPRRTYGFKAVMLNTGMRSGLWGVLEPDVADWAQLSAPSCIAVPGVAFSDSGGRVGHGKGYYDRMLAFADDDRGVAKVGVCFDFQRFPVVPSEAWDIGMDVIVSETGVNHLNENNN